MPAKTSEEKSRTPGNRLYYRLGKIDRRLDNHEVRISATEAEVRALNLDIAQLTDIAVRARERAAARLMQRVQETRRRDRKKRAEK